MAASNGRKTASSNKRATQSKKRAPAQKKKTKAQAAQDSAKSAADASGRTSYEQMCRESEAAYAARNPHKRQEKEA